MYNTLSTTDLVVRCCKSFFGEDAFQHSRSLKRFLHAWFKWRFLLRQTLHFHLRHTEPLVKDCGKKENRFMEQAP